MPHPGCLVSTDSNTSHSSLRGLENHCVREGLTSHICPQQCEDPDFKPIEQCILCRFNSISTTVKQFTFLHSESIYSAPLGQCYPQPVQRWTQQALSPCLENLWQWRSGLQVLHEGKKRALLVLSLSLSLQVVLLVARSCLTFCGPMDYSPPGSSVHGILQARILEWGATPFSRGSSRPRDWTWDSWIAGRFFTVWATREALSTWGPLWNVQPATHPCSAPSVVLHAPVTLGRKDCRAAQQCTCRLGINWPPSLL